ncbi:hypothetical protein Dip510_001286 [Elusimicrobium posterum]
MFKKLINKLDNFLKEKSEHSCGCGDGHGACSSGTKEK